MMTEEEKLLFSRFITDNVYKNDIVYRFTMVSGDVLIVEYDGEGEFELNPITDEYEDYYVFIFYIKKIEINITDKYFEDGFIVTSKYDFPVNIELLESKSRT